MRAQKTIVTATLALAMLGAGALASRAEDAATMPVGGGMKADMLTWIKDGEEKLVALAEATPEGKFSYRPGKGVRSTGEVFMHVAAANFGLPQFWGVKAPEGFKFDTYEASLTKKADIIKALEDSFEHMESALAQATDADFEKPVEFFGMKSTVRGGYLLLLSHTHEHLGQSIAYARVNGMTPPWTAKQEAEMKAAADKKKAGTAAK